MCGRPRRYRASRSRLPPPPPSSSCERPARSCRPQATARDACSCRRRVEPRARMQFDAIKRLLAPRSIALFGGVWADAVAAASRAIGYDGALWRVHPSRESTQQAPYFRSVEDLPGVPDAAFIAAPNYEVPKIAAALARRGAGGFVCFAAGFSETATTEAQTLTEQLIASAADLPFFGPNCYGFINFFEGAALWPDQVVGERRERGVALLCQSGTIALNLLFNHRSVPIGYVITVGHKT